MLPLLVCVVVALTVVYNQDRLMNDFPRLYKRASEQANEVFHASQQIASKAVLQYSADEINASINAYRQKISLEPLSVDSSICDDAAAVFQAYNQNTELTQTDLTTFCSECSQKAFLTVEGNYIVPGKAPWMEKEDVLAIVSQEFTHVCTFVGAEKALLLFGQIPGQQVDNYISQPIKNFTQNELWQALVDYRHAHAKPDLLTDDKLCQYAQKRVFEHISLMQSKPKDSYKNPDKYPLDAHVGFEIDGDSGYLFEATGFKVVAENLAYWPTAQYPIQVIEWGWDTSTEGHREAQLSDEYTHACLVGQEGFYVAIFAHN